MSEHTPGPWGWDSRPGQIMVRSRVDQPVYAQRVVAAIRTTAEDADLIAAAPDLLAALTSFGVLSATPEWLAMRDAAVAKAKGKA